MAAANLRKALIDQHLKAALLAERDGVPSLPSKPRMPGERLARDAYRALHGSKKLPGGKLKATSDSSEND
jgi:hypothetical protein